MHLKSINYTALIALVLALFVVMLGAYTRLTDAGLGCPDWPGCYGHLLLPSKQQDLALAQNQFPKIPIETRKAWTEMAHRYAAGSLGFLIFYLVASILWQRFKAAKDRRRSIKSFDKELSLPWKIPIILMILLIFQAVLGMWTVTMKLLPVVVMGHLLGGILIFSCLCLLPLQLKKAANSPLPQWGFWLKWGLLIVFFQIALGGWVSSNYAGIACIGFPQCNGQWFPPLHFAQGFNLFSPVGANYQGGVLDNDIRMTIQLIHRFGAILTAVFLISLSSLLLLKVDNSFLRRLSVAVILLVCFQFILGIMNVLYLLPLWIAVAHNGIAALLLACLMMMLYLCQGETNAG